MSLVKSLAVSAPVLGQSQRCFRDVGHRGYHVVYVEPFVRLSDLPCRTLRTHFPVCLIGKIGRVFHSCSVTSSTCHAGFDYIRREQITWVIVDSLSGAAKAAVSGLGGCYLDHHWIINIIICWVSSQLPVAFSSQSLGLKGISVHLHVGSIFVLDCLLVMCEYRRFS